MIQAELERPISEDVLHGESPVRLLAVRLAGAPFLPPFDLRSQSFEILLEERRERHEVLAKLRESLVDALFQAVPTASDRETRRQLLEAKRRVFKGIPLESTDHLLPLPDDLLSSLRLYRELTVQQETCFEAARDSILREIRVALQAIWEDPRFRLACRFASPALAEDLEKKGFPTRGDLTSIERGLYAFASRRTSKANPFHLFAEVAFPPASGITIDGEHEIVLDAGDLLAMERSLLQEVKDPRRIHLGLASFERLAERLIFWVLARPGFRRVARLAGDPILEATIEFFTEQRRRSGRPTGTLAEWLAVCGGCEESLEELCREGIVERYLILDLDHLGDLDPGLEQIGTLHLARLSTSVLEGVSAALPVRFYVNSYRCLSTESFEAAAEEVGGTLHALKPFFAQEHNFSRYSYVIAAYFVDYLAYARKDRAPYLHLLRHFLRHHQEIIPCYQPEIRRSEAERQRLALQTDRLRRLSGRLDTSSLRELGIPAEGDLRSLCFNGPFDFEERIFYVSNIFAGSGRFAGRYLLHRRRAEETVPDEGDLHVELAVPPEPNLNYVVRRYPVGCGFEARYAHRYERWIDPSEVLVARDGDGISYRDAVSGRRLRFHYSGFQLAPQLPTEYQLLLVGHADCFHNPFQGDPQAPYDPGLQVGPVCVRRESWTLGQDFWSDLARERNSVRFAAYLRERVWDRLAPADLWYYRWPEGGWGHHKPRFLDLRSPLSAHTFQREIAMLPVGALLSLSPMRPAPERVSELMIEV